MNFLIIGKFYTEGFAQHIAETILDMGHTLFKFEPGRKYIHSDNKIIHTGLKVLASIQELYMQTPAFQKAEEKKLLHFTENREIDIAIVCHDFLTPRQVDALKKNCKKVVLWFPDAIVNLKKAMCIVSDYDCLFFKDPYIVNVIKNDYGISHTQYLPECANIKYLKPVKLTPAEQNKYNCDLSFAGNLHSYRVTLLKHLKEYDVKVWGNRAPLWMNTSGIEHMIMNEFVANDEKAKAFIGAKININSMHPGEVIGVNVRTFEIAACGAFQICNYRSGLADLYTLEEDVVTFHTIEELKDKINYYLNHEEERVKIGNNAYLKTVSKHTYQHRIESILDAVFGSKN